jgi:hypothetical protein
MVGFGLYVHGLATRKWQRVKPISGWEILDADLQFNRRCGTNRVLTCRKSDFFTLADFGGEGVEV